MPVAPNVTATNSTRKRVNYNANQRLNAKTVGAVSGLEDDLLLYPRSIAELIGTLFDLGSTEPHLFGGGIASFNNSEIVTKPGMILVGDKIYYIEALTLDPVDDSFWGFFEIQLTEEVGDAQSLQFWDATARNAFDQVANTRRIYRINVRENYNNTAVFPATSPGWIRWIEFKKNAAFGDITEVAKPLNSVTIPKNKSGTIALLEDLKADLYEMPVKFSGNENSRIKRTAATTLSYPSFSARINNVLYEFTAGTLSGSDLDTGSFPSNTCVDYYIFVGLAGGLPAIRISLSKTSPTGLTHPVIIGGFHFGVVRTGIAAGDVSFNQIVPRSVWTRKPGAMPSCYTLAFEDPTLYDMGGMVEFVPGTWADIYLVSDPVGLPSGGSSTSRAIGGKRAYSRYGAVPLSGTEGLNMYDFIDRAQGAGKRLLTYAEWLQVASGSPQGNNGNNDNGWTRTTNTQRTLTGAIEDLTVPAGYAATSAGDANYRAGRNTSLVDARDCVGNLNEWVDAGIANRPDGNQGFAWRSGNKTGESSNVMDFGSIFSFSGDTATTNGYVTAVRMGGSWNLGVFAGSRSVSVNDIPWSVAAATGSRFACDSL